MKKPHFRLIGGEPTPVATVNKPHLKVGLDGRFCLVRPGRFEFSEADASHFIQRHYGTRSRFASRLGVGISSVTNAMHPAYSSCSGQIRQVRLMLGLPSNPSRIAQTIATSYGKKRLSSISASRGAA